MTRGPDALGELSYGLVEEAELTAQNALKDLRALQQILPGDSDERHWVENAIEELEEARRAIAGERSRRDAEAP